MGTLSPGKGLSSLRFLEDSFSPFVLIVLSSQARKETRSPAQIVPKNILFSFNGVPLFLLIVDESFARTLVTSLTGRKLFAFLHSS